MKPFSLKSFFRGIGIAMIAVFWVSTLAIAQPYSSMDSSMGWIAQATEEHPAAPSPPSVQPAETSPEGSTPPDQTALNRQPKITQKDTKSSVEQKSVQSGGPYDLKTIEESYRSLYGS